jgi:glycosyltransferase involved in cell wall biosynthesis
MSCPVLYIAGTLPSLSETFVSGELLALRQRGVPVLGASVHSPREKLLDPELEALAREVVSIYGPGSMRLVRDAVQEALANPRAAAQTFGLVLSDALASPHVSGWRRFKVLWQGLAALALARRVRPRGVGHIHAHLAHVPTTVAMYAARELGIGFSFTGHANDLFPQRTLLPEKLERAAFVACISHWHRALYGEFAAVPTERLPVIRCGVDVPPAAAVRAAPASRPLQVLGVGRLVAKKGFDLLIDAVRGVAARGVPVACTIIGGGPDEPALRRRCGALRLTDRVQLLGPQSHAAVREALCAADVFVLPCRVESNGDRDGIPVVLMEAMAAGVPVIAGELPAIRELVCHNETGWCIPPGDLVALIAGLSRLAEDGELRARLGRHGRAWVTQEFERGVNVERLVRALEAAGALGDASAAASAPSVVASHARAAITAEYSGPC